MGGFREIDLRVRGRESRREREHVKHAASVLSIMHCAQGQAREHAHTHTHTQPPIFTQIQTSTHMCTEAERRLVKETHFPSLARAECTARLNRTRPDHCHAPLESLA